MKSGVNYILVLFSFSVLPPCESSVFFHSSFSILFRSTVFFNLISKKNRTRSEGRRNENERKINDFLYFFARCRCSTDFECVRLHVSRQNLDVCWVKKSFCRNFKTFHSPSSFGVESRIFWSFRSFIYLHNFHHFPIPPRRPFNLFRNSQTALISALER